MPRSKKTNKQVHHQEVEDLLINENPITHELSLKVSKLSYEEALDKLDLILGKLQNETIPVEEMKISYLEAILYLDHCEKLLKTIEQEVVEIETDALLLKDN